MAADNPAKTIPVSGPRIKRPQCIQVPGEALIGWLRPHAHLWDQHHIQARLGQQSHRILWSSHVGGAVL